MTTTDEQPVVPTTPCAVCGHLRGEHETIERERCAACACMGSRQAEANHLFVPKTSR